MDETRGRKHVCAAVVTIFAVVVTVARAETITFEEPIAAPDTVLLQYCNVGVEFLNTQRVYVPPVATSSPPNALTNYFVGDEFTYQEEMKIRFTAAQSSVSVNVGLDRRYESREYGDIEILAYSDPTPGTGLITSSSVSLGTGPHPITETLTVSSFAGNIRSVLIRFGPDLVAEAWETIDDLTFDVAGPPCGGGDTGPPTVNLHLPADGSTPVDPETFMSFTASDDLRVAQVEVAFLDGADAELASFFRCGGGGLPCPTNKVFLSQFNTVLPAGTAKVRVTATDFFGNSGSDEHAVALLDPGPEFNLWAQALEITQATQSWLPVNTSTRSASVPAFVYPDFEANPDAVPLVAGRTTVVRLLAGVEDTLNDVPVGGIRATLRCYNDAMLTEPCPGLSGIVFPESRPPDSLQELIVDPADDVDTRRRDLSKTWNFILPRSWVDQPPSDPGGDRFAIYLEAEVSASFGVPECAGCDDAANRIRVLFVPFRLVPSFSEDLVHQVRVERRRPSTGASYVPSLEIVQPYVDYLRRTFPVDESTVSSFLPVIVSDQEDENGNVVCSNAAARSAFPHNTDGECCSDGFRIASSFLGGDLDPMAPGSDCGGVSLGWGDGYAMTAFPAGTSTTAQEIGHANGVQSGPDRGGSLPHAGPPPGHGTECIGHCFAHPEQSCVQDSDCENENCLTSCEKDWPRPHGLIGAFGFDVLNLEVVPPDRLECLVPGACDDGLDNDGNGQADEDCVGDPPGQTDFGNDPHDFMSYGTCKKWISPRTWVRLFNGFTQSDLPYPGSGTSSLAAAPAAGIPGEAVWRRSVLRTNGAAALLVGGKLNDQGDWILAPAFEVGFLTARLDEGAGNSRLELRDSLGQVLAARNFDLPEPAASEIHVENAEFSEVLPLPAGVEALVLLHDGGVLAQRNRTASAPVVTLLSPNASGFEGQPDAPLARWIGSDADSDPLSFMVRYTPGGGAPWKTIGAGITGDTLPVVLEDLEGSAQAMVRVLASDGLNTTTVVSPAFVVPGNAPRVEILAPPDGISLSPGERAVARGLAFDTEDGALGQAALSWSSDLDGVLGGGTEVDLSMLGPGSHLITLQATDSDAQSGFGSITVEVDEPVNRQPVADAGPDQIAATATKLDGEGSVDPDGDPLGYRWTLVGQPPGAGAVLSNDETAQPTLSTFTPGTYEVELVVDDGQVESLADTVVVEFCTDSDADGACADLVTEGLDCDDGDPLVYPGAPEVNDGQDQQCPGDDGFGLIDEVSGAARFGVSFVNPVDRQQFYWPAQTGADLYRVLRSDRPDFASDCTRVTTPDEHWVDEEIPLAGHVFYYMVQALDPNTGTWGADSAGRERVPPCEPTVHALVFQDNGLDNVPSDVLFDMFSGLAASSDDYILIGIREPYYGAPTGRTARCMERADWYVDNYLSFAMGGNTLFSGTWSKWWYEPWPNGQWSGPSTLAQANDYGFNCFENFAWCAETGLGGQGVLAIRPHQSSICEAYFAQQGGCGFGTWQLTIRIGGDRLSACGF